MIRVNRLPRITFRPARNSADCRLRSPFQLLFPRLLQSLFSRLLEKLVLRRLARRILPARFHRLTRKLKRSLLRRLYRNMCRSPAQNTRQASGHHCARRKVRHECARIADRLRRLAPPRIPAPLALQTLVVPRKNTVAVVPVCIRRKNFNLLFRRIRHLLPERRTVIIFPELETLRRLRKIHIVPDRHEVADQRNVLFPECLLEVLPCPALLKRHRPERIQRLHRFPLRRRRIQRPVKSLLRRKFPVHPVPKSRKTRVVQKLLKSRLPRTRQSSELVRIRPERRYPPRLFRFQNLTLRLKCIRLRNHPVPAVILLHRTQILQLRIVFKKFIRRHPAPAAEPELLRKTVILLVRQRFFGEHVVFVNSPVRTVDILPVVHLPEPPRRRHPLRLRPLNTVLLLRYHPRIRKINSIVQRVR